MKKLAGRTALAVTNTHLRQAVEALTDCLRELLRKPNDPIAIANARLVLAMVAKFMRELDGLD